MPVECFLAHKTSWVRYLALHKPGGDMVVHDPRTWEAEEGGSEVQSHHDYTACTDHPEIQEILFCLEFCCCFYVSNKKSCVLYHNKTIRKMKVPFQRKSVLFLMPALTFHCASSGSTWPQIFQEGRRHHLHFLSNLFLYSGLFIQCIYRHLPHRQYDPKLDVWYSNTPARKQLLLLAPDPSTLDILVSSVWPPPIQDLPMIQHGRKLLGHCHSLMASFQHN